eukprot:scaffold81249_cov67-Phaeocystis_antarctica.AAC.2
MATRRRALTPGQVKTFCELLLGCPPLPEPDVDRHAFLDAIDMELAGAAASLRPDQQENDAVDQDPVPRAWLAKRQKRTEKVPEARSALPRDAINLPPAALFPTARLQKFARATVCRWFSRCNSACSRCSFRMP